MADPSQQYPDLDRMVEQRRLGYLDQQALLRQLNRQRMLAGQQPATSLDEIAAAPGPRPVAQTEVAPLALDPKIFGGRGVSVQSYQPAQDPALATAAAGVAGGSDFGGLQQLFQQGIVPLPPPRPAAAGPPAAAAPPQVPQVEQPAQPRSRLPLSQQRQPLAGDGSYPRGANYMTGAPGQNIALFGTPAGNIQAHAEAGPALQGFVSDLVAAGAPITSVGSYNMRRIAGSQRWSQHAYGNAIDINQSGRNVVTPAFREWAAQHPDALRAAQVRWNIRSGADWSNPDFGHFEWAGPRGLTGAPMAAPAPAAVAPAAQSPQQPLGPLDIRPQAAGGIETGSRPPGPLYMEQDPADYFARPPQGGL